MVDDVPMPSNPPITPVEKEKLKDAPLNKASLNETPLDETPFDEAPLDEAPLDINVFQWSREENRPEEWCALKSIVRLGIIDCLLTHIPF